MSEFLDEVKKDIADVEGAVENFFDSAVSAAEAFLSSLAHSIAANGGPLLIEAATNAVAAAEATGGGVDAKFAAAVESIKSTLSTQGVQAAESAINGAIEAAVAALPKQVDQAGAAEASDGVKTDEGAAAEADAGQAETTQAGTTDAPAPGAAEGITEGDADTSGTDGATS